MPKAKKATYKELVTAVHQTNHNMMLLDQHYNKAIGDIIGVLNNYIDFEKNGPKFEKFMKKRLKEAKILSEKNAKSEENKVVTAKEVS